MIRFVFPLHCFLDMPPIFQYACYNRNNGGKGGIDILLETKAKEFVCRLQRAYLVERDVQKVLSCMDEDVEWIGTGEQEIGRGIKNAEEFLEQEYRLFPGSFAIVEEEYNVRILDGHTVSIFGVLVVQETGREEIFESQRIRMTLLCREEDGELRILQIHMSAGSENQKENEFFPRTVQENNRGSLIRLLDEQAILLREQNENLNALMENVPGGVMCCEFNENLDLLQYSRGFLEMFGYTREEIEHEFKNQFKRLIYPDDLEATWKSVYEQLARGKTKKIEYRVICRDGSLMAVLDHGQLVEREGKEVFYCILTDITENRKVLEELRLSLERHRIIMEQTNDIIFEWNMADDSISFSDNWVRKFGYYPISENVSSMAAVSHVHPDDMPILMNAVRDMRRDVAVREIEIRIARNDGTYLWCRIKIALQETRQAGRKKAIGVISDIDKEKRNVDMLVEKALHDALTGLYNKAATAELGGKYIEKATSDCPCAFVIIDLDNFKYINDVYGHLSGDVLLSDIALLLKRTFRSGDIIGRIGGDEFVVIMPGARSQDVISDKFEQIRERMEEFLERDGYMLSCSAGAAFAPLDGCDYQTLYKNADLALYKAKEKGKNQCSFYHSILQAENSIRRSAAQLTAEPRGQEDYRNQTLGEYVFTVLQQEEDISKAITQVLEIVGRQFGVSRVYVFEDSEDGATCSNTFEWCNEGVKPQKDFLQDTEYTEGNRYDELFDENGIFYCRDINGLTGRTKDVLASQEIVSMLQCLLKNRKKRSGFIGFDQCWEKRIWTREQIDVLSTVSGAVGVFLTQLRMEKKIKKLMMQENSSNPYE